MSNQMMDTFTSALIPQAFNLAGQFWWLILLLIIVSITRTAWFKGVFGEWIVNLILRKNFKEPEYSLFKDVMLPTEDGTTQIDHILFSKYGIFVIETKNMKGWIFGNETSPYWTQQIFKNKFRFQNPLRQNYKHTKTLSDLIEVDPAVVHSIIVFVGDATFKTPMPNNVLTAFKLRRYISEYSHPVIDDTTLEAIKVSLSRGKLDNSFTNKRKHIAHAKSLKKMTNTTPDERDTTNCPRCGGSLVMRTSKRGTNEGKQFLGCSNYPKCRFIRH
ncbi:NERD domain-containing protein [Dasania sp. GY-19]|jgi:restriction system protein|uniref:NERD domain-containing protein n=1 Tax=Dasania phycosphaerae TaxID=2950436 RepID=A0A9J6RQD2_9GAMM|nr:NERD domain-containing protein [Dasania phycosphaerae]MBN56115.1 nuclease [Oceanospirillaceae bacterium]MCZ0866562.1 NERD domain-containing protein [Dasania phycosphaerae]|tara:strand:- start:3063 stop:3881 length:819 start_codon:yes stop_codon:yes gene_type:complete